MEAWSMDLNCYRAPQLWTGRNDGAEEDVQRWHQRIKPVDLGRELPPVLKNGQQGFAIVGFCCDEGVRRNLGRVGAADGPPIFRQACASLPVHLARQTMFIDAGDIVCTGTEMETAQAALALAVSQLLHAGYRTLVAGGGHEMVYGHDQGLRKVFKEKIGIINFDAHFDLREPGPAGPSSGTSFWQIAQQEPVHYLALGIQHHANTKRLFDTALAHHADYVSFTDFTVSEILYPQLDHMLEQCDHLYVTIDLDVFGAAWAPGVSAINATGLQPDAHFFHVLRYIFGSGKVRSADIAEFNPRYDHDQRTAKLAATLAFEYFMT